MARPFKHPKTGMYWFRRAVPKDLQALVGKREELRSLKTKDPIQAREAYSAVAAEVDAHWKALRSPAQTLSNREITALAGTVYGEMIAQLADEPGSPLIWEQVLRIGREFQQAEKLGTWLGPTVDALLKRKAVHVDAATRSRLVEAVGNATQLASVQLQRNAEGDYRPDSAAARFPEWKPRPETVKVSTQPTKTTLPAILEDWWREAQATGRKPSTYESYGHTVACLTAYLRHEDALRVTPEDVVGFKDHRLATINPRTNQPISAKTVKDSDLSALKTLFGRAVINRRLPSNPAAGITIKLGKAKSTRGKGFTDDEARELLNAASTLKQGNEHQKTFNAKRWVPWLCAYTGARVGELVQLRKQDLRKAGDHWVIHITPEAGTVKTDEARDVVLHEHLVAKGFPEFVQASGAGHLFVTPASNGDVLGPLQGVKNRLAEVARVTVPDPRVAPNHGWRHRFKSVGRSSGIDSRVLDAIQGHAPRTAGDDYGDVTVAAMAIAMIKFPRQV